MHVDMHCCVPFVNQWLSLTLHWELSVLSLCVQKLQCSPTSDGAAAAILANEEFVKEHKLEDKGQAKYILGLVY